MDMQADECMTGARETCYAMLQFQLYDEGDVRARLISDMCHEDDFWRFVAPLNWVNIGDVKPTEGEEVSNRKLSDALAHKTSFSQQEWNDFDIQELSKKSYVKGGSDYFVRQVPHIHEVFGVSAEKRVA